MNVSDRETRINHALDEFRHTILARYPTATFRVTGDPDDSEIVQLWATVDVDDPDEVTDLVIDRMLHLQVEERLPVYVIPVRTVERVAQRIASRRNSAHTPAPAVARP